MNHGEHGAAKPQPTRRRGDAATRRKNFLLKNKKSRISITKSTESSLMKPNRDGLHLKISVYFVLSVVHSSVPMLCASIYSVFHFGASCQPPDRQGGELTGRAEMKNALAALI